MTSYWGGPRWHLLQASLHIGAELKCLSALSVRLITSLLTATTDPAPPLGPVLPDVPNRHLAIFSNGCNVAKHPAVMASPASTVLQTAVGTVSHRKSTLPIYLRYGILMMLERAA